VTHTATRFERDQVKLAAMGRWREVLPAVTGISSELLDGRNHPCPKCGGSDRFFTHKDFAETGGVGCRHCFPQGNRDGLAAVIWLTGCPFREAVERVAAALGMAPERNGRANGKPIDIVDAVCKAKRMPREAFERFGVRTVKFGDAPAVAVDVYGADGALCSTFYLSTYGDEGLRKGRFKKGKPAGMFFPGCLPQAGETWCLVEGPKDAALLVSLDLNAAGLPGAKLPEQFARLFRGVHVVIVPDLDRPGDEGAKQTAARLEGIAESVAIARLPGEWKEAKGDDCRDVFHKHGAEAVLEAIQNAKPLGPQRPRPVSIGRMIADYRGLRESIIHGIARRGETVNVIAPPKLGKSWLMYYLALCVATGKEWLGFACREGRVLYLDLELHRETTAHRFMEVAKAIGLPLVKYEQSLDVISLRGCDANLNRIASDLEAIEPGKYDLCILDAWYRALPAGTSETDNAAVMGLYNLIDSITGRLNCAWLNIHHASKGNQSAKEISDVGSGAGAQSRAADTHLILRPHEESGCVVMEGVLRSFAPMPAIPLRWEFPLWRPDDGLDPTALKGARPKGEERQNAKDTEGADQILAVLHRGPATISQLREKTGGMGEGRVKRLVWRLESEGKVIHRDVTVRGNATKEYLLADGEASRG
jgi:hypothetical protein